MKQPIHRPQLTAQETRLVERLRQQPELRARLVSLVDLADAAVGPLKTADAVETLLIEALRELGRTTLQQWATQAEARVSDELRQQDPTVRSRKKNADVVVCLWLGERS